MSTDDQSPCTAEEALERLKEGNARFVVMGHEECGAVKAAIDSKFHGAQHKRRN